MLDICIQRRLSTIDLDVDLSVGAEVLALFGMSGSGKSMTLKVIAGIEPADQGHIRSGKRLLYDSAARVNLPSQQRHVGYVPQHYALFPHMTALENITFPLRKGSGWSAPDAHARASELLDSFGLSAQAQAMPGKLSGGQQQRVSIARALAGDPEVLLLDEPFAALDAPTREELREEFRQMQRRLSIPVVLVTHDLEEAATLATRMAVIVDGHIQQVGDTRAVLDFPANRQVAVLVRSRNILRGRVRHDPDGIRVDTPVGALQVSGQTVFQDGAAVDAVIRPEAIRIVRSDSDRARVQHDTIFEGTTVDIIDHGTRVVVHVEVRDTRIEVSVSPTAARRLNLSTGSPIELAIRAEDVHLMASPTG